MARGHPHEFEKAAKPDGDLAAEGVGVRQQARGIDQKRHDAILAQVHEPGLAIVRVGREQREAQRAPARILALSGGGPGQGGGARLAGCDDAERCGRSKDRAPADDGEGLATGQGHGGLYMMRYRTT